MWLSLALVELARGESVTPVGSAGASEDAYERGSTIVTRGLIVGGLRETPRPRRLSRRRPWWRRTPET